MIWLFYKIVHQTDTKSTVEFARFDLGGFGKHLPAAMKNAYEFDHTDDLERELERYVRKCGWVGRLPVNAESEVGKAVIKNRPWPID